jgi:hypothetical protein
MYSLEANMYKTVAAMALAASILVVSEVRAQSIIATVPTPGMSGSAGTANAGFSQGTPPTGYLPYSYYAALPFRARGYVGYGFNDFPFYGQPYGRPTDTWSWQSMSRSYYAGRGTFGGPVP